MFVISSYAVALGAMFKYTFEFLTYVFDSGYIIEKDRMKELSDKLQGDNSVLLIPGYNIFKLGQLFANKDMGFPKMLDFFKVSGVARRMTDYEEKTMSKQNRTRELRELKLMKQELLEFIEDSKKELEQEEQTEDKKLSLKK